MFSKKREVTDFQRVYDAMEATLKGDNTKLKSSGKDTDNLGGGGLLGSSQGSSANPNMLNGSVIIDKKKVSHQLGAKIGAHPTTNRKQHNKRSLKKFEKQLLQEKNQPLQDRNRLMGLNNNSSANMELSSVYSVNDSVAVCEMYSMAEMASSTSQQGSETKLNTVTTTGAAAAAAAAANKLPRTHVVFGVTLSSIMQQTGQPLPQPILEAMRYLRKISPNEVGIFRKNGVKTRINRLKEAIDSNEPVSFPSNDFSVFDVADTVKLYFRELPECLITNKLSDVLLTNYSKIRPEERKIFLQQLMLLIPDENRLVLQTLLLFLSEIAKHNKTNQMTRNNLAVCFSPVIFHLNVDCTKLKLKSKRLLLNKSSLPVSTIGGASLNLELASTPPVLESTRGNPLAMAPTLADNSQTLVKK